MKYEKITTSFGSEYIERTTDDGIISYIPIDEANSDYQVYLKSLEEGIAQQPEGNI